MLRRSSRRWASHRSAASTLFIFEPTSTKLVLVIDECGLTMQFSTTHQTQAGVLAHFLEVLAQLHHQRPATKAAKAATLASSADLAPAAATSEPGGPAPPINPFIRPRPACHDLDNGREEPPF